MMLMARLRTAAVAILLLAGSPNALSGTLMLGHDKITFENTASEDAADFHFTVSGTFRGADPKSDKFARAEFGTTAPATVSFSNGTVTMNGGTTTIEFQFQYDPEKQETGKISGAVFTRMGGGDLLGSAKQLGLNGTATPNGALVNLTLTNDSPVQLNGTVGIFVNTGLALFDTSQFDALRPGFSTILATQPFSVNPGQTFANLSASLGGDQYVLVLGTVTDSVGTFPFSEAFVPIPEPSTLVLAATGMLVGLCSSKLRRRFTARTRFANRCHVAQDRSVGQWRKRRQI
jgi:hypothetical protein